MVTITLRKNDFDDVVYDAVASDSPKDMGRLRVINELLEKLEAVGSSSERSIPDGKGGTMTVQDWTMSDLTADLELENGEAEYLHGRLLEVLPQLHARRSRYLIPLIDSLDRRTEEKKSA